MAQELKAYNVVATADVNPDVIDSLGCTEWTAYYADEVDAVLAEKDAEIRRLQRALWLARAERAKEKQQLFHFSLDFEKLCIDGFYDPYSGRRELSPKQLSPKQWIKAFNKVEVKLLKKAEEFK